MKLLFAHSVDLSAGLSSEEVGVLPKSEHVARLTHVRRMALGFQDMRAKYKKNLIELLGAEGYQRLTDLRLSRTVSDPRTIETSAASDRARTAQQRAHKQEVLKSAGVDVGAFRAIGARFADEVQQVTRGNPINPPVPTPTISFQPADLPDHIRELFQNLVPTRPWPKPKPKPPNPWTVVTAPFPFSRWEQAGWCDDDCIIERYSLANSFSGRVGQEVRVRGSCVMGDIEQTDAVGFRYTLPQQGRLEIVVDCELADHPEAEHYVGFRDEYGFSDGFAWQRNSITTMVEGVESEPWTMALMSGYQVKGDDEGSWQRSLPVPNYRVVVFTTNQIFPKDRQVLVWIGSNSWNRMYSDDMWVTSAMKFQWLISQVAVRTVPFPP